MNGKAFLVFSIQALALVVCDDIYKNLYKCYDNGDRQTCFQTEAARILQNWTIANATCQNNGSTLPVIKSAADQSILERFIMDADLPNDDIWIGLYIQLLDNWTWPSGAKPIPKISGDLVSYIHALNVSSFSQDMTVAIVNPTFTFSAKDVSNRGYPYICQYPSANLLCQSNKSFSVDGKCFVLHQSFVDWFTARSRCRAVEGGDLANFESLNQINANWLNSFQLQTDQGLWTGLRRILFNWTELNIGGSNNSELLYARFQIGQPASGSDRGCISTSILGYWSSGPCNNSLRVICQTNPPATKTSVSAATNATTQFYSTATNATTQISSTSPLPTSTTPLYFNVCLDIFSIGWIITGAGIIYILTIIVVSAICCSPCARRNKEPKDYGVKEMVPDHETNTYVQQPARAKSMLPYADSLAIPVDTDERSGYDQRKSEVDDDEFDDVEEKRVSDVYMNSLQAPQKKEDGAGDQGGAGDQDGAYGQDGEGGQDGAGGQDDDYGQDPGETYYNGEEIKSMTIKSGKNVDFRF